jgi:hypothetical protein
MCFYTHNRWIFRAEGLDDAAKKAGDDVYIAKAHRQASGRCQIDGSKVV